MQDNQYPPEWDEPIDEFDPWLGAAFDQCRPTPAQRALIAELVSMYVDRDRRALNVALDLVADSIEDERVPALALGLLEAVLGVAVDGQGIPRAVERLRSRLDQAQYRALRDVAASR